MNAAIVFDMDGVLADTETLKFRAHREAVEARGGALDRDLYRREMGGVHEEVVRAFLAASGLEASPGALEAYEERFRAAYRRLLARELAPMEGAPALLERCRGDGRRLALVTSSERWMAETVLEGLGARDGFEAVVTADDVSREKPHPEPYRRARSALGSAAERAVAVEDTRAGVASAAAAGLPVVAVRHALNRGHCFDAADAVLASLAPAGAFLAVVDRLAGGAGG
jgi:phosphoglycolate phosphatase